MSPLGRSRAGAGAQPAPGMSARRSPGSSGHRPASGLVSAIRRAASNAAPPCAAPMPAHWANASGVVGPKTCRYRRASSMRASIGSTTGAVTAQMVGARAPSQRIRMVPVGAAYRIPLPTPSAQRPRDRHPPIAEDVPHAGRHLLGDAPAARIVGPPAEREYRDDHAPESTYTLNRGPHTWTSEGSSQVDGWVPATRAWIESSAARGMLSCRPAHAARRSESGPGGSRSSSAWTFRRYARIWVRVSLSRRPVTSAASAGRPRPARLSTVSIGSRPRTSGMRTWLDPATGRKPAMVSARVTTARS